MTLFRAHEADLTSEFGLMGRVLDVAALAAALEPVWIRRVRDSGIRGGSFYLSTSASAPDPTHPCCGCSFPGQNFVVWRADAF
jgi:hypothetical protein